MIFRLKMRLALFAALSLAACAHHTAAQSCDDLEEQLRVCRLQELPPATPAPDTGFTFTCDGVLSNDGRTCCALGCGEVCGGEGCSDRGAGLTADDCCVSSIQHDGPLCSIAGKAPCVVEAGSAPTPTPEPPVPAPTMPPATSPPEPAPIVEPTSTPFTPEAEQPASAGGGDSWIPNVDDRWAYNLDTPVDVEAKADVFFIDLDVDQETIDELHDKGKWVSCYISVGTVESWREDAGVFPSSAVGDPKGWSGEKFLDITSASVQEIMEARVKKAARKGCDAIEPDNMSSWNQEGTGFNISKDEQILYNKWFVELVREHNMLVGMKSAVELIGDLSDYYDFAISVECLVWDICDEYVVPFLAEGKPVFNVEYNKDYGLCPKSAELGVDTIFKNYDLKAPMCSCADSSRDLDCDEVGSVAPTPTNPVPTPEPPVPAPATPTPTTPAPVSTPAPTPESPDPKTDQPTPAPLTPTPSTPTPSTTPSPVPSEPSTPEPTSPTPAPSAPTPPTSQAPGGGGGWVPKAGNTWNYNLNTPVDTSVDVDVFFIDMDGAQTTIDELHRKGKWVSCYISVGTMESWRADAGAFPSEALGLSWDDWVGETFVDVSQQSVRDIMQARIEKAAGMNCDAIEPDNMSNWNQKGTGLTISREEQVEFNRWFAETCHENGMKVGMKNAIELLGDLHEYFDFAINEECHQWNECGAYMIPFVNKGKPVFNVEYDVDYGMCDESNAMDIDTIFKEYALNAALCSCADSSRDVDCSDVTR